MEFKDTRKSSDLSAVQVDEKSSYTAEDTSFVGFQGEVWCLQAYLLHTAIYRVAIYLYILYVRVVLYNLLKRRCMYRLSVLSLSGVIDCPLTDPSSAARCCQALSVCERLTSSSINPRGQLKRLKHCIGNQYQRRSPLHGQYQVHAVAPRVVIALGCPAATESLLEPSEKRTTIFTPPPPTFLCFVQAVVFSEGILFLDNCDFSGSTAPQLVYTEPDSTVVIRNTVLGGNNCESRHVQRTIPWVLFHFSLVLPLMERPYLAMCMRRFSLSN